MKTLETPRGVNKIKRKAAGHTCLLLFQALSGVSHGLYTVADNRPGAGEVSVLGQGLTEKERAFVRAKRDELNELADVIRRLGWRFLDRKHGT